MSIDEALRALEKAAGKACEFAWDCEVVPTSVVRALLTTRQEVAPVAHRWLDELRDRMEHCISAADEGEDYAVPRDYLDAMTTLGLMKKVGRGKWAPTEEGEAFAERRPTLPVEIYGKFYEVPIPVQLHIVNLMDKLTSTGQTSDARDALQEILRVHANDNHRPQAFYIAAKALAAMQEAGNG